MSDFVTPQRCSGLMKYQAAKLAKSRAEIVQPERACRAVKVFDCGLEKLFFETGY
jgi:hypothetical protein